MKLQSSWDLTTKEIAKNEKKLKKKSKQRPSVKITKGILELMNLAEPLMAKEQTTLGEPTMKNLAKNGDSSENGDLNGNQQGIDNTEPQASKKYLEQKSGILNNVFS